MKFPNYDDSIKSIADALFVPYIKEEEKEIFIESPEREEMSAKLYKIIAKAKEKQLNC